MSAQATISHERPQGRSRLVDVARVSGIPALASVGLGGLGLGVSLWYVDVTHETVARNHAELALFLSLFVGVVLAFAAWSVYGTYVERRAKISLARSLRWDAPTWLAWDIVALGIIVPTPLGSPGRAAAIGIGLFGLSKILIAARFVYTVRDVLTTFIFTRASIIVVAEIASIVIAQRPGVHVSESTNRLLAVWGRWDAVHYLDIAKGGYYGTDMAFFPLFPTLTHVVGSALGSYIIGGLIVSNVALFFGLLFFYKLVEHEFTRTLAHRAIFYISIFPTAVFFSAVYTESLFFALTVASFYYIRQRKWLLAGIIGGFAALSRVEGVLLVVPLAIEALSDGWPAQKFRALRSPLSALRVVLGLAAIALGLAVYMTVLWVLRGDPLFFSHVQAHWGRHLAPPWVSVMHSIDVIGAGAKRGHSQVVAGQVIELAFTALMIGVLAAGARLLRPSLVAYTALSILVPMSTSSLMSMPRFALVLFPLFTIFALWGRRTSVNNAIVAFSLPLLGLFTVLFTSWYWVA